MSLELQWSSVLLLIITTLASIFLQAAKMYSFGLTLDSAGSSREASPSTQRTWRDTEDEGSDEEGDMVVD